MAYGLKTKIWQTGQLEWYGLIDNEDLYLGSREFPQPPAEGDEWTVKATGFQFRITDGEIRKVGQVEPETPEWL